MMLLNHGIIFPHNFLGPEAVAQKCLDYLAQVDIIYVTFDVDSMDSTICMGTGTPVPG